MIDAVDDAISALIERDAVNGGDVEVSFEVPSKEWAAKRNRPTVNAYLFDVREELERRRVEPQPVRGPDGHVTGRKRPPRFFRLSYLLTAWTKRPEDEHRLLSAVLLAFLSHERVPEEVLPEQIAELDIPLHLTIGEPPPAERSIGELWTALGGELKPSVELRVIVPFDLAVEIPAGPPVTEEPRLELATTDGDVSEQVEGRKTDDEPDKEPAATLEETVTGGGPDEPGRVLRLRSTERP